MARAKTTVYLDEELLRAAKVQAARTGRRDYEVFEEALRQYLGLEVLEQVWSRAELPEGPASELAYRELRAARKARRR
jgi:predicted transcriptional regulator